MPSKTNPGKASSRRQLDAVLVQLGSQRPSDVWRGMDQVRQWLTEDPENREVYGLLLDAVKENRELREQVRTLLSEMMQKGSRSAHEAISSLPSGVKDFSADADDAYYAGEYERAIQLYRQVLKLDPENARAKNQIAKAEINRITGESDTGLPRAAHQYYRRARSFIAAREVVTAMNLLSAAIEAAHGKDMQFPEAEEALSNMNNLLLADDFRQRAKLALEKEQWREALELYSKALTLDPTNEVVKKEADSLQDLLRAETQLNKGGIAKVITRLDQWQNTVDSARIVMNPDNALLISVEKQLNQIRLIRSTSVIILFIGIALTLYLSGILRTLSTAPSLTQTLTPTIPSPTNTSIASTNTATEILVPIIPTTPIIADTSTATPTETLTLTPTLVSLGIGYINKGFVSTWDNPNGRLTGSLGLNQIVTILEERIVAGSLWNRCQWEVNGNIFEGWILGEYITFGTP